MPKTESNEDRSTMQAVARGPAAPNAAATGRNFRQPPPACAGWVPGTGNRAPAFGPAGPGPSKKPRGPAALEKRLGHWSLGAAGYCCETSVLRWV